MADSTRDPGWAEHERQQRQAWLRLTGRQRLEWLWQARTFSLRAEAAERLPSSPETVPVAAASPSGDRGD
jgi:hypothetical protein